MRELRTHVEFFGRIHECNKYDGDYIHRFVYRAGRWIFDNNYLIRIDVVRGKVVFRRMKEYTLCHDRIKHPKRSAEEGN